LERFGCRGACELPFFCEEQIDFDFRPENYRTLDRWSALCEFFQEIVNVVGKSGVITHENTKDHVIDRFEPRTNVKN
jgi:hypothetical protein